jgi:hypothetical protein
VNLSDAASWLAHLYAFCKGGNDEVGGHSFSFASANKLASYSASLAARANQSVEAKIKNVGVGCMSPHLYKKHVKVGQPPERGGQQL